MKVIISLSAGKQDPKKILAYVKMSTGKDWPKLEKWIKQETKKADSSDFWKGDGSDDEANDEVIDKAFNALSDYFPNLGDSPEPLRATLDKLVELTKKSK